MNIARVYLDALELLETREVPAPGPHKDRFIFILNACAEAAGYGDLAWGAPTEDVKALSALARSMEDLPL
jgi:hypothetical protein